MTSNNKLARIAGFLYLIMFISVFFAIYLRSGLIVPGDITRTANQIMASELLFRIAFVSDMAMIMSGLFLALVLYLLLNAVNKNQAMLMVLFTSISVAILCVNMLNLIAPLLLLSNVGTLTTAEANQLHILVNFFLQMHDYGYVIGNIFFGLWLIPLGILIIQSGYFPKVLGVLLIIACFGYLIDFFVYFLFPDYGPLIHPIAMLPAFVAELAFCLWLLIKGVKDLPSDNSNTLATVQA